MPQSWHRPPAPHPSSPDSPWQVRQSPARQFQLMVALACALAAVAGPPLRVAAGPVWLVDGRSSVRPGTVRGRPRIGNHVNGSRRGRRARPQPGRRTASVITLYRTIDAQIVAGGHLRISRDHPSSQRVKRVGRTRHIGANHVKQRNGAESVPEAPTKKAPVKAGRRLGDARRGNSQHGGGPGVLHK